MFGDVFNCLPVAAVLGNKIFCMHGGLSSSLRKLSQINEIRRPCEVPDEGILCDLLWADPDKSHLNFRPSERGISYSFGSNIVTDFVKLNDLDLICRAHQVVEDGYEFFDDRKLVTLFSAPNYCGEFDNAAGMMTVDKSLMCSFHVIKPKLAQPRRKSLMF